MVKTITISGKSYDIKSSAFTLFAYKDKTGRDLIKDLQNLEVSLGGKEMDASEITPFLETILTLTYVLITEQNKGFKSYEEWLKDIDSMLEDNQWISDVLECAIAPIKGRI